MGKRSRRTGNREERSLAAQLPGARKISRSGYTGPDIEWRGRTIEAKYRTDGFTTLYRWLREVQILDFPGLRTRARTRARTARGVIFFTRPGPGSGAREKGWLSRLRAYWRYGSARESH